MDTARHGTIGALAANRPLLISVVLAFGLTALAVTGFIRESSALTVSDFAINAFFALAAPALIARFAPPKLVNRLIYVLAISTVLIVGSIYAPGVSPKAFAAFAPSVSAVQIACVLLIWFVLLRPLVGDIVGLGVAAPVAAVLGAFGASGFLALEAAPGEGVIGAIASLSLALSCLVGVGVAADFAQAFARGGDVHDAAGVAAYNATSAAVYATLITFGVFVAGLLPAAETINWSFRAIIYGAAGVALAVTTTLLVTASALSLAQVSEQTAVTENHRRQNVRRWWRPLRQALPPSSALAFVAILMIITVTGLFTAYEPITLVKVALLIACALFAGLTFVSIRTGIYVFTALLSAMVIVRWIYEIAGTPSPSLLAELTGLAVTAALYGQVAIAWRDARNPSRNAREAAERAMIDGAHRYAISAAFVLGALFVSDVSGLWSDGAEAAFYTFAMTLFGFLIAAPLMTAISAVFGRE